MAPFPEAVPLRREPAIILPARARGTSALPPRVRQFHSRGHAGPPRSWSVAAAFLAVAPARGGIIGSIIRGSGVVLRRPAPSLSAN